MAQKVNQVQVLYEIGHEELNVGVSDRDDFSCQKYRIMLLRTPLHGCVVWP